MQRDLVERRGWISKEDYLEGSPSRSSRRDRSPRSWRSTSAGSAAGVLGATLVGRLHPARRSSWWSALSALYVRFGGLTWMQGAFYGIGAAVIAIIARSAYKLVRMTLAQGPPAVGLFALMAGVTAWTESEIVWLFLVCGVVVAC